MNQLHKILKTVLLISIYCFGIFVSVKTLPSSTSSQTIEQNNKQKTYYTSVSKVLYIHTQQSENLLSENTEYLAANFTLLFKDFCDVSISNELLFKTKFKQYLIYFKNLLIKNRKSDLIFPFHNFW